LLEIKGQITKIEFRLGTINSVLEVPPFYVNFHKRTFSSILERRNLPIEGVAIYVYVTRHRHVEKLLVLKRIHPDIYVPREQKELVSAIDQLSDNEVKEFIKILGIEEFADSIMKLEKEWKYVGNGVWLKNIGSFTIYMILIIGNARWTVRPVISKRNVKGYGFEIPVETAQREVFMKEINKGELEEIHDHIENLHFHLTVDSLERCISLARTWDYYFSNNARWKQTVLLITDII
jgi:hypothetical protein